MAGPSTELRDCLDRLAEAEKLLAGVRQVEVVLAGVRCSLLELGRGACDNPAPEDPPAAPLPLADVGNTKRAASARQLPPDQIVLCSVRQSVAGREALTAETASLFSQASGKDLAVLRKPNANLNRTRTIKGGIRDLAWKGQDVRRGFLVTKAGCLRIPVLFPDSPFTLLWDLMGLVFIIFETFALPVYLSFRVEPEGFLFAFVSLVNAYFLMDVPLNFLRGFKDHNGAVVMLPASIARRYRKWVGPDLLASIPWEWVSGKGSRWAQLTKMLRLLRVARLLRLMRLEVLSDEAKIYVESNSLLCFIQGVIRVLFILFSVTHWAACIWFYIGANGVHEHENSWVSAHLPPNAEFASQYMYSLYFTLTTMTTVGYGDITPQNDTEVFVTLILLLIATVVFATLMGALTDLICSLQSEAHAQEERVRMLSSYMNWRRVPPSLFRAIRKHMLHLWETNRGYDAYEQEAKESLPPILRRELSYHVFGSALRSATFLSWMWSYEACMKELANAVTSVIYAGGDVLFHKGQANLSVYVLLVGLARLSLNEDVHQLDTLADPTDDTVSELNSKQKRTLFEVTSEMSSPRAAPVKMHSPALMGALERMQEQDSKEKWAACLIQRKWLRKKRLAAQRKTTKQPVRERLRTCIVEAPAYFGESCLWEPFELWGARGVPEPKHRYTVRCENISEVMIIPRSEIQGLVERFSPWLRDRFEQFRSYVVEESDRLGDGSLRRHLGDHDVSAAAPKKPVNTSARLAALALRSRGEALKLLGLRRASPGTLSEPLLGGKVAPGEGPGGCE